MTVCGGYGAFAGAVRPRWTKLAMYSRSIQVGSRDDLQMASRASFNSRGDIVYCFHRFGSGRHEEHAIACYVSIRDVLPHDRYSNRLALVRKATNLSRQFRFDPRKGVPESERRLRVADYRRRQELVKAQIRQTLGELRQRTDATRRRADELASAIQAAQLAVMRARADASVA